MPFEIGASLGARGQRGFWFLEIGGLCGHPVSWDKPGAGSYNKKRGERHKCSEVKEEAGPDDKGHR